MALLVITALFAGGALYLKYKLENLRATVQAEVESRTGARLRVGSVLVDGLRGLRLHDVEVHFDFTSGPALTFTAPACFIYINVVDLLYGTVTVERIVADRSLIRLVRPSQAPWLAAGGVMPSEQESLLTSAFRLTGANSTLEVVNIVGDSQLVVNGFNFDVGRLQDSPDITAKFSGRLGQDAQKEAKVDLRYTSLEDFDLRMQCEEISPDDVAIFLPSSQKIIKSGTVAPSIRVAGYPNNTLIVAFETSFNDLMLQDQPQFLMPAKGSLAGIASYDSSAHVLTLDGARAESNQVGGRLEGTVSFAQELPVFDLRLDVTHLPLTDVLDYSMTDKASQYGILNVKLQEPYQLQLALQGTSEAPTISVLGNISGGEFAFAPKTPDSPQGKLKLGMMTLSWNSQSPSPAGSFAVVDGSLTHAASGLKAEKVAGTLTLNGNRVTVDPLTAEIGGNPFVGNINYDLSSQQMNLTAAGTLPELEALVPKTSLEGFSAKGPANIRCSLQKTPKKTTLDAEVDATQTQMDYQWWFAKPAGVGATFSNVHVEMVSGKMLDITGKARVASSEIDFESKFTPVEKNKWKPCLFKAGCSVSDVGALGKCVLVPYKISGGTATAVDIQWLRPNATDPWQLDAKAQFDNLSLLPQGSEIPLKFEGLAVSADIHDSPDPLGDVSVTVEKASMPPLKGKWFVPMNVPPELKSRYSITNRPWALNLSGKEVSVDHWKGSDFKGKAYVRGNETGLSAFQANLEGGGQVHGAYSRVRDDNKGELAFTWDAIQAHYLIKQLGYANIFTGTSSGEISYTLDSDDPATLKGKGQFAISEGQFSADYLVSKLEGSLKDHITSLPVNLKFSNFKTDLALEGDQVTTSNLQLNSNGINVTGNGKFFLHGDVDYSLKVAITPDLAEKIPALRDNMNVQGLRLAQQNVELAFNVQGPIFNPQAELSSMPPVAVTVVSSALEVTSDAMRVIDIPRKILVDLLKIGGGIVGMSK